MMRGQAHGRGRGRGGILILARFDSRRLPGKALRPIAGRALLGRVLDRARAGASGLAAIIATSDRPVDDPIATFAEAEGAPVWRGAGADVLGRCIAAARHHRLDWIVRISGDSPFIDPALIDRAVALFRAGTAEIVTNVHPRSFPVGMSVEILALAALERIAAASRDPEDREHVSRHAYAHPGRFAIAGLHAPPGTPTRPSLAVDTEADLRRAEYIATRLPTPFSFASCIQLAEAFERSEGR